MAATHSRTTHASSYQAVDYWDGLITETDAADYLCQSVRTIQKWRVTGYGPRFYKSGRSVRYRRRDLSEWIERRSHGSTSSYNAA